jgi:hypothetical protein
LVLADIPEECLVYGTTTGGEDGTEETTGGANEGFTCDDFIGTGCLADDGKTVGPRRFDRREKVWY